MNLRAVKGMNDILPDEIGRWQRLEQTFREVVSRHGYREVRTPIVEPTPLFVRAVGEATDIVEKEMYSFEQRGEPLTMRPEGTAGAARAYIEHTIHAKDPVARWYYLGPMFRAERPQRGRYRQFYQLGCEAFGDPGPAIDAEMIDMIARFLGMLGIGEVTAYLNSIGNPESRARYRDALIAFFAAREDRLSDDSRRRLRTNPLRILDSKDPRDIEASADTPSILDLLVDADRAHFDAVRRYLDRLGTPYQVDRRLVRGLDYYTRTAFELRGTSEKLGAQNALGGGGRYDHMIEELGGPKIPAIGFALGVERLLLAMPDRPDDASAPPGLVFVAPMGDVAVAEGLALGAELRALGTNVVVDGRNVAADGGGTSLKALLRRANALGASLAVVVGESELARGVVQLKDMAGHGPQEDVPRKDAARIIAGRAAEAPASAKGSSEAQ